MHSLILAGGTGILWVFGLRDVVHEHLPWEVSLALSAVAVFLTMFFLMVLFWTPAVLDKEIRQSAKKQMVKSLARRERLSQKIIELTPPPETERDKRVKQKLSELSEWEQKAVRELFVQVTMTNAMAAKFLGMKEFERPLAQIKDKLLWLERDQYDNYTIKADIKPHLQRALDVW